jgi:hypothetical protein
MLYLSRPLNSHFSQDIKSVLHLYYVTWSLRLNIASTCTDAIPADTLHTLNADVY